MKSIRRSLVTMLIAAFTLVSFVAALNGYRASMDKAEALLDAQLQYSAEILIGLGSGDIPSQSPGSRGCRW